jgi:hypothetical protein
MKKYKVSFIFSGTGESLVYQIEATDEIAALHFAWSHGAEKSNYEWEEIEQFADDIPIVQYRGDWLKHA